MANIVLTGDTSGAITVSAPAVAGTNTLTLPAATGTLATTATAGKILQVVSVNKDSSAMASTTSSTPADTGLTVDITPSATSSKILIVYNLHVYLSGGGLDTGVCFLLNRKIGSGSFSVLAASADASSAFSVYLYETSSGSEFITNFGDSFVDSPSTTSTLTYKVTFNANAGGTAATNTANTNANITVMEIAG